MKHFEDGCWDYALWIGSELGEHNLGKTKLQIATESFRWSRTYKPIAKAEIIEAGTRVEVKKKGGAGMKEDKADVAMEDEKEVASPELGETPKTKLRPSLPGSATPAPQTTTETDASITLSLLPKVKDE